MNKKNVSTMQPFKSGDIFLGCTDLNNTVDDHKGDGRILQYDENLQPKGILYTEGTDHLVIGLTLILKEYCGGLTCIIM